MIVKLNNTYGMLSLLFSGRVGSRLGIALFLAAICPYGVRAVEHRAERRPPAPLRLDISDDGKQIKLLVKHPEIGLICEFHCYEAGPFHYGKGVKRDDGSVVLTHTSGKMTSTSTFTSIGEDRVSMDILIEGPREDLKQILYIGPCMQFWHSEAFKRRDTLVEFAQRCSLYTMRGPVGMMDTALGRMSGFKPDAPENNPPCTQWYVPVGAYHPGDIWAFGASGDRPIYGLVAVASRDGKWLAAHGGAYALSLGNGWHDCIHLVPQAQAYLQGQADRILIHNMIYVVPNDNRELLRRFRQDFPKGAGVQDVAISTSDKGILRVAPRSVNSSSLDLSVDIASASLPDKGNRTTEWKASPWGGFVRSGANWRMWAYPIKKAGDRAGKPHGDAVELCVSMAGGEKSTEVEAMLGGRGWTQQRAPVGVPAVVRRSADGAWIAALMWEQSEINNPARGVPMQGEAKAGWVSARGRLYLYQGDIASIRERWTQSSAEWKQSGPYYMPVAEASIPARRSEIRFVPGSADEEERMAYGLRIVPPWKDGGTLLANFPEHFEYGEVGHGILRYSDKRTYAWKIAQDGRSANYEVESPDLPGVIVRATAVAEGDRARLTLRITNKGEQTLDRVKPLLCFWYGKMAGFPARLTDNFVHTNVVVNGKLIALSDMPTKNPGATAKVAYIRGCDQHDCDKFANSRGGLIDRDIDRALIAVTSRDGKRKCVISFTPGKSILSNAFIPCAHADPFFGGTLKPGESREVKGLIVFTEGPIEAIVNTLLKAGAGAPKEVAP